MRLKAMVLAIAAALCAGRAAALIGGSLEGRCEKAAGYDAIAACSDIIGIGTGEASAAWALFDRARAYFKEGMYGSAVDDLTAVLRFRKDDTEALENRGLAYLAMDDYGRAIDDFDKLVDLQPNSPNGLRERCFARAASGRDLDDALQDCNKALKLGDMAALDARCFLGYRMGQYAAAIADCTAALARNPKLASSLYVRGLAKMKSGDAAGGQADLTAAAALDPSIADTYANYGVAP